MKKIILVLFFFAVIIYFFAFKNNRCLNNQAKIYKINNKSYCLFTANNQEQWQKGLMFYKKPVNFDGMVFIFPEKETRSFWNKNTYMDLDVYWMDGDTVVGKDLLQNILKSKEIITVKSNVKVNRVIEIVR